MTRPDTPFEAASYDLNKFRERRLTDRRFVPRATAERRTRPAENKTDSNEPQGGSAEPTSNPE
jgi:hypothetical protein